MKKLTIFIILTSIFGITYLSFSNLFPSWYFRAQFLSIFEPFRLDFFDGRQPSELYRYINIVFNLLFLISGIFYYFSKGKETRLIRFLFSIILFSKITGILTALLILFTRESGTVNYLLFLLYRISDLGWIYLSYRIVKRINGIKLLNIKSEEYNGAISTLYVSASSSQRLFHLIVDLLVTVLVFSTLFSTLVIRSESYRALINFIAQFIGDRPALLINIAILRLIYYVFYEAIFQASPAKFLTETRVIDEDGNPINLKTSITRTVSRFVPFEAFSFVFSHTGWHDKWSKTTVVEESRTGIKGKYYFLIFPLLLLLYLAGYIGMQKYESYVAIQSFKKEFMMNVEDLDNKLKNLKSNDFIKLQDISDENNLIHLKPEQFEGNKVIFSMVTLNNTYEYHPERENIEQFYVRNKDLWPKITLDKSYLSKGIVRVFNENSNYLYQSPEERLEIDGISFEGYNGKYIIKSIEPYFEPKIVLKQYRFDDPRNITLSFNNMGWNAKLIKISNIKGDIGWHNSLPMNIYNNVAANTIYGRGTQDIKEFEFDITVQDSLGRIQVYKVEGDDHYDSEKGIKRLK